MNNFNPENCGQKLVGRLSSVEIVKAKHGDLPQIKSIADKNKNLVGFVMRGSLIESIQKENLIVLKHKKKIIGFINYHHRKDAQTTLYEICVDEEDRKKGYGRLLINHLLQETKLHGKRVLLLNCPVDGVAHSFYLKCGFKIKSTRARTRNGKKLITWVYEFDN